MDKYGLHVVLTLQVWDSLLDVEIPCERRSDWIRVCDQVLKARLDKVSTYMCNTIYV